MEREGRCSEGRGGEGEGRVLTFCCTIREAILTAVSSLVCTSSSGAVSMDGPVSKHSIM